jgi:hypothetical protein
MKSPRRHHAVAFVLSVFITLTIFSGVSSLAGSAQTPLLAQAAATPQS